MPDKIHQSRPVFFVSNSTGITVETLGRSLLYQFSTFRFESHSLRYIDTNEKAYEARELINKTAAESGKRPIILSTMINKGLRDIISSAEGLYLDIFDAFISPLEMELGSEAMLGMGHSHGILDDDYYSDRIEAVNYSLKTDDGIGAKQYFKADVILTGVSRSGKTPTSLYLAMHYGLCAANYPIVEDELEQITLPAALQEYRDKLFGLLISPERLHSIRTKRKPHSDYASLSRCRYEVRQTETMFQHEHIPYFDVSSMSIEEIASTIMSMLNLSPRTFVP
jgi:regulator of PEP synthase PpsR (kinase-PPPase family)